MSATDGWLKLHFASCVIRITRSLGVLVLCSNWTKVFVNYIYDTAVDAQFHKLYGRPFARVLYLFLMKDIGRWLPWVLAGSAGVNIEKRQLWVRTMGGWNSTLQAAWHVRHAHWPRLCYVPFAIWCLWITSTVWLMILSSTSFMVGRSRVFYIYSSLKI